MPNFNCNETDISIFLAMFERQAKGAGIEPSEWVRQLLSLLPLDISQIILRETDENSKNYETMKKILPDRFRLSPEAFRVKFAQHVKQPNSRWKDYAYELKNYFECWIKGLGVKDYEAL